VTPLLRPIALDLEAITEEECEHVVQWIAWRVRGAPSGRGAGGSSAARRTCARRPTANGPASGALLGDPPVTGGLGPTSSHAFPEPAGQLIRGGLSRPRMISSQGSTIVSMSSFAIVEGSRSCHHREVTRWLGSRHHVGRLAALDRRRGDAAGFAGLPVETKPGSTRFVPLPSCRVHRRRTSSRRAATCGATIWPTQHEAAGTAPPTTRRRAAW
jgi:hypothetical protein